MVWTEQGKFIQILIGFSASQRWKLVQGQQIKSLDRKRWLENEGLQHPAQEVTILILHEIQSRMEYCPISIITKADPKSDGNDWAVCQWSGSFPSSSQKCSIHLWCQQDKRIVWYHSLVAPGRGMWLWKHHCPEYCEQHWSKCGMRMLLLTFWMLTSLISSIHAGSFSKAYTFFRSHQQNKMADIQSTYSHNGKCNCPVSFLEQVARVTKDQCFHLHLFLLI